MDNGHYYCKSAAAIQAHRSVLIIFVLSYLASVSCEGRSAG
jgi:hypothetical protein